MFDTFTWIIAKVVSIILAWFDIADLRGKVQELEHKNKILRIALEDIARIDKNGLCGRIAMDRLEKY